MDFFIGGIIIFGGNFAPRDWAFCAGQLVPISQNQALYAILGTIWGGDGRTNFGVPDLRSRAPVGAGQGVGLTRINVGVRRGSEIQQLTATQMPAHSHQAQFNGSGGGAEHPITATVTVNAFDGNGDSDTPVDGYWANAGLGRDMTTGGYSFTPNTTMNPDAVQVSITGGGGGITGGTVTISQTGNNHAFSIMQPVLGINYIINMMGLFPTRN